MYYNKAIWKIVSKTKQNLINLNYEVQRSILINY